MIGRSAGLTILRNRSRSFARYAVAMNNPVPDQGRFAVARHGALLPPNYYGVVSLPAWTGLAAGGLLCWGVILSMI